DHGAALSRAAPVVAHRVGGRLLQGILGQGILGAVAHIWWYEAVRVVGPSQAAIFTNLQPIIGIVLAPLLLGERIGVWHVVGTLFVLAGVGLTTRAWSTRSPSREGLTLGRELLDLGEDLLGVGQLALAVALDEPDLAVLGDDERRADVGVPLGPIDAVVLGDVPVDVREQRVMADADRPSPVVVAEGAVRADTQHLGIGRLKVADALVEGGHAGASARRPVERIEEDHHVLAVELREADLLEADRPEREVGRGVADVEDLVLAQPVNPPFADLRGARSSILTRATGTRAGGLRAAAHARLRRLSSGAASRPRCAAAVTTRPVSQRRAKRSTKPASRRAWWSMMTRHPVASITRTSWSIARSIASRPTSRSRYDTGPETERNVGR